MYSHTQNEDGTYNSRCLFCFLTIARSVVTEAKLEKSESRHICPEMALSFLNEQQKTLLAARAQAPDQPQMRPN